MNFNTNLQIDQNSSIQNIFFFVFRRFRLAISSIFPTIRDDICNILCSAFSSQFFCNFSRIFPQFYEISHIFSFPSVNFQLFRLELMLNLPKSMVVDFFLLFHIIFDCFYSSQFYSIFTTNSWPNISFIFYDYYFSERIKLK